MRPWRRKSTSDISVNLKFTSPTGLLRSLDDGTVDIIVASGKPRRKSKSLLIDRRRDCIAVSPFHPLASREEVDFSELRQEKFIAISRASSEAGYESIILHAAAAGFTPDIVGQADTISAILMQVACDAGISVLYKEHHANSGDNVVFIPLRGEKLFNRYLLWSQENNPCINAMIEVAKNTFIQSG